MRVLGLMSGTSLDGVDAAIIDTDGVQVNALGSVAATGFEPEERAALDRSISDALCWNGVGPMPQSFAAADVALHAAHVRVARQLLADEAPIDLIGFHGQTVLHRPERQLTVQLGDAGALARALGAPVVADMRQADVAAHGNGAPLVPIYHAAIADYVGIERPCCFLNVGGVANLTLVGRDDVLVAFDTGPGNGLIDQMVVARGLGAYDDNGALAAAGTVNEAALEALLALPFFRRTGPRSVDRYDFPIDVVENLSAADAAATLTDFTAQTVAMAVRELPQRPNRWLICGGGCHNPTMMAGFRKRLGDCRSADEIGLRGDFIEAEAMAFLAARSIRGLALTFPGTTGVHRPLTGGKLYQP